MRPRMNPKVRDSWRCLMIFEDKLYAIHPIKSVCEFGLSQPRESSERASAGSRSDEPQKLVWIWVFLVFYSFSFIYSIYSWVSSVSSLFWPYLDFIDFRLHGSTMLHLQWPANGRSVDGPRTPGWTGTGVDSVDRRPVNSVEQARFGLRKNQKFSNFSTGNRRQNKHMNKWK